MDKQELYFAFLRKCKELCGHTEDGWEGTVEEETARKGWLQFLDSLSVKEVTAKTTGENRGWVEMKKNTGKTRNLNETYSWSRFNMTKKPAKDKNHIIIRDPWRGLFMITEHGIKYGLKVPKDLALKILVLKYVA